MPQVNCSLVLEVATCGFVAHAENLLLCGPTGTGKSYLAIALACEALKCGYSVLHCPLHRLLANLQAARADGSFARPFATLCSVGVLVLNDCGQRPLSVQASEDLYELRWDEDEEVQSLASHEVGTEVYSLRLGWNLEVESGVRVRLEELIPGSAGFKLYRRTQVHAEALQTPLGFQPNQRVIHWSEFLIATDDQGRVYRQDHRFRREKADEYPGMKGEVWRSRVGQVWCPAIPADAQALTLPPGPAG